MPRGRPKQHMQHRETGEFHTIEGADKPLEKDAANEGAIATLTRETDGAYVDRRKSGKDRPTSWKIQPYDSGKGFDERQYDLRLGEIGNPGVPIPHAPRVAPVMANQSTGLCVECGKGVAPGQNYVCRDHIRTT